MDRPDGRSWAAPRPSVSRGRRGGRPGRRRPRCRARPRSLATSDVRLLARRPGTSSAASATASPPHLADRVRRAGGARAWFETQLDPASVADPGTRDLDRAGGTASRSTPRPSGSGNVTGVEARLGGDGRLRRWTLAAPDALAAPGARDDDRVLGAPLQRAGERRRVVHAPRRLRPGDPRAAPSAPSRASCEAAVLHPAMLIYLDNAVSTKKHPNENLGRELLELHTVGRGNYTEDDVKASARILTGYRVDLWDTLGRRTTTSSTTGSARCGCSTSRDPNPTSDGRQLAKRYLSYLAHHPATAQRVARKLAVKFVRDDPSDVAGRPAGVGLPGPRDGDQAGAARPGEVTGVRRLGRRQGARPQRGRRGDLPGARHPAGRSRPPTTPAPTPLLWQAASLGNRPFGWPRPDGQPVDNRSWSSPSRLIASMSMHLGLCGGWWPTSTSPTASRLAGRRRSRSASTTSSSTSRGSSCTDRHRRRCSRRAAPRSAARPATRSPATTRSCAGRSPTFLTTFLDSPTFLHR